MLKVGCGKGVGSFGTSHIIRVATLVNARLQFNACCTYCVIQGQPDGYMCLFSLICCSINKSIQVDYLITLRNKTCYLLLVGCLILEYYLQLNTYTSRRQVSRQRFLTVQHLLKIQTFKTRLTFLGVSKTCFSIEEFIQYCWKCTPPQILLPCMNCSCNNHV